MSTEDGYYYDSDDKLDGPASGAPERQAQRVDFEFYETPAAFTCWLFREMTALGHAICGTACEPCVGDSAILRAAASVLELRPPWTVDRWITNDLDPRWPADQHLDASQAPLWAALDVRGRCGIDWTVSNPPFTPAIEIINRALEYSRVGVAMHLRASIHEVLKTGVRRTWMQRHTPTGILWLPRFAYQRSKTKGTWTTDSVCACWVIWLRDPAIPQFIRYAPVWVIDALDISTPAYRTRMDHLMGYVGTEAERQEQRRAAFVPPSCMLDTRQQ